MTSWMSSFGGMLRRSRSDAEVLHSADRASHNNNKQLSLDLGGLPELTGESEVLGPGEVGLVADCLPPRLVGAGWRLVFTTSQHGFSLGSLYRHCGQEAGPALLCVRDTRDNCFGALLSSPVRLCDHFYGTGESLLFTCQPEFAVYHWSGDNQHFVRATPEHLVVGAGAGQFGLYLDSSLYQGRSQACSTFSNPPLVAGGGDFVVKTVEVWAFD